MNNKNIYEIFETNIIKPRKQLYFLRLIIKIVASILWAYSAVIIALWLFNELSFINYIEIFVTIFVLSFFIKFEHYFNKINLKDFLIFLELRYPFKKHAAFELKNNTTTSCYAEWIPQVTKEIKTIKNILHNKLILSIVNFSLALGLVAFLCIFKFNLMFIPLLKLQENLSYIFQEKAYLEVLEGFEKNPKENIIFKLNKYSLVNVNLLSENLIKISIIASKDNKKELNVFLYDINEYEQKIKNLSKIQSFKLILDDTFENSNLSKFSITLTVTKSSYLVIPYVSSRPIARIHVSKPPIPQVELVWKNNFQDEIWPDNKELQLEITAYAQNNLKDVYLQIYNGNKKYEELVANIMLSEMKTFQQTHTLSLEKYMEEDIADIEIVAKASDRSMPVPFVGYSSPPIHLKVASAYGRYQKTLEKLGEIKNTLDNLSQNEDKYFDEKLLQLIKEAMKLSYDSPFFDAIDRSNIGKFEIDLNNLKNKYDLSKLTNLRDDIANFLFEHEALDDRERDRDFFVALRSFSHLMKLKHKSQIAEVIAANDKIINFVQQRMHRWDLRVKRLPSEFQPKEWNKIKIQKPFEKTLKDIKSKLEQQPLKEEDLNGIFSSLSVLSSQYKNWIEKLEQAEDAAREDLEKKRQESLASIEENLKLLQKTQDEISYKLDNAPQNLHRIQEEWPSIRMQQNSNIENAKSLEAKIRSLVPQGYQRLQMAIESMKATVEYGNQKEFILSESASDTAARLLRETHNNVNQKKKESLRRAPRKRTVGDKYYGKQIIAGDVQIIYQHEVEKKYREEILDDVLNEMYNNEKILLKDDKKLLENYLYEIIR